MEKLLHWLYRDGGQLTTVVARGNVLVTISAGHLTPLVSVFDAIIQTGKPLRFLTRFWISLYSTALLRTAAQ